jgi:hypothetical protein
MGLKFRRGTTAQQSGSLAFGEPYVNTTLGTLVVGGATGDIVLSAGGTGSTGNFGAISGSGLDITGNANIAGNLTLGGTITIGDNSSDNVVVNADLSSSIIPNNDNSFDLGSASFRYRAIHGTNIYGAINATNGVVSGSSQVIGILDSLNTFSGSQLTQNSALATITGSLITSASTLTQRVAANEAVSGTFARTNSTNIFNGAQTISGSLTVTQDLLVLGSSSIQNISSSNLVIGAAYVTLNAFSPSSRFAGLNIIDSGSSGGSGSLWYDAVQDEFIQIHKGNGTNVTSSHFIQGPQTYDNVGNELYLTNNRLVKGTGLEHIVDSNITDNGTLITLGSNTYVNGTFYATGTVLVSGSAQVTALLPTGVVSGSSQTIANLPTGTVSGSSQITYASISSIPAGIVSGSSQVTLSSTTGGGTSATPQFARLGIGKAADSQIAVDITSAAGALQATTTGQSVTAYVLAATNPSFDNSLFYGNTTRTASSAFKLLDLRTNAGATNTFNVDGNGTGFFASNVTATGFSGSIASTNGVISGSSQVTLSSTTGYGTVINQNLLTTSDVRHASLGIGMAASGTSGRIDASGDVVAYSTSDKNFKENITPIENPIEKIRMISGNTYDWKADMKEFHGFEGNDVGVIAQEIEAVLPQLVTTRETGYKAVKYDKLVALLIEGIKAQQNQIDNLTIEIEKLKESKGL